MYVNNRRTSEARRKMKHDQQQKKLTQREPKGPLAHKQMTREDCIMILTVWITRQYVWVNWVQNERNQRYRMGRANNRGRRARTYRVLRKRVSGLRRKMMSLFCSIPMCSIPRFFYGLCVRLLKADSVAAQYMTLAHWPTGSPVHDIPYLLKCSLP
jgi:hypothetical protein